MLSQAQQERVGEAVKSVESRTNAELVTVIAATSDDYRYIPALWAALVALLLPSVLYFTPLSIAWVAWLPIIVFIVLNTCLQLGGFRSKLVPKAVATWRASNMACRQFLEHGLHHTDGETGVLIFVSEAEHFVEILVDRGIKNKIDDSEWQDIVDAFIRDVRAKQVEEGFLRCLESCADILAVAVPKTPDNKNELDDRLVLIGYD